MIQILIESRKIEVFFYFFFAILPALEASQKLTLQNFHGCKMTEKLPKTSINCKDPLYTEQWAMDDARLSRVIPH